jgi:DNA modification methylase
MGRKFVGIEQEASYFDIACKRIEEAALQPDMLISKPPEPPLVSGDMFE